jgi:colanic acid/amylovoran biosynthesis glycosyltransferase
MGEIPCTVLHYAVTWLHLTERWLYWQVKYLPSHTVSHITCEKTQNLSSFSLPFIHTLTTQPRLRILVDKAARRLGIRHHLRFVERVAEEYGAKILHSHFGHVGWGNIDAAKRAGLKHVVSFYGADASYLPHVDARWRARYRELFASADLILCQGPFMAQKIESMGCGKEKVVIHPLGVPVDQIKFLPRIRDEAGPLGVLIAASFQEKKGIPDAVKALSSLQRRVRDLRITIIGDASGDRRSEQEKQRILGTLNDTGLLPVTRLMGYQMPQVLHQEAYKHDIFLSPSRTSSDGDSEGGAPMSIIEMAATGMPVVSTRHADIPSTVRDGETGLLAEEGDIDELAEHLFRLAKDPDLCKRMGAAGRLCVQEEFEASKQSRRLAELYQVLI